MTSSLTDKIVAFLKEHHIPFTLEEHEDTPTSAQAANVRSKMLGIPPEEVLKRAAKSMILRSNSRFFQFVLPGNKKIDFKKVKKLLGSASTSLATPDEVLQVTGVQIGGVPPFGNLFNIPVYLEQSMLANEQLDCNAGSRGVSLTMNVADYVKTVKPIMVDFAVENTEHVHN